MTKEEVKNLLLQELKKVLEEEPRGYTQMNRMADIIRSVINRDNIPPHEHWQLHNYVFEVVNEWYRAGVIHFGRPDDPNSGTPWFTITDFGKECLKSDNFLPYDPDKYIVELQSQVPLIDNTALIYLKESIATYNREQLLSSAITLGVASEHIILTLIESFMNAINNPKVKAAFNRKIGSRSIYKKYQSFREELEKFSKKLPSDITKDLEVQLEGVFNFIRLNRNQAGHPTGTIPSKKIVSSNLQIFAEYSKKAYQLIDYFNKNKI